MKKVTRKWQEYANEIFTPDPKDVAQYSQWLEAFKEASAAGKGAIQVDGVMLDEAAIPMLKSLIEQAEFLNSRQDEQSKSVLFVVDQSILRMNFLQEVRRNFSKYFAISLIKK